jgi:uncharacterized phage-like protein YoqJ
VSGYRSYELNIFDQTDPKYLYLKEFIKSQLKQYIENGVEWFIITGQLGIELWTGEIVLELQEEYPEIHLAVILPFTSFGENWNETNQALLERVIHQADYVNYSSNKDYESPKQLNANQVFTIRNTDGAFLIYDTMMEESANGSPKYVYDLIEKYQEKSTYELNLVGFEEIEFFIHEYNMFNEGFHNRQGHQDPDTAE